MRPPPAPRDCRNPVLALLLAFAIAGFGVSPAGAVTLIPQLASWKYLATASAPAASWKNNGFDDGAWISGSAVLGYGETYITTTVPFGPSSADKYRTTYFRRTFSYTPQTLGSMTLTARYDDGFVAYLNGTEVARRSLPGGTITWSTFATSHEATAYETIDLTPFLNLLVSGANVLAVEVHQTTASSSDLVWDAGLTAAAPGAVSLTREPYLQSVTPNQATIRWRTSGATAGEVRWGLSASTLDVVVSAAPATFEHELTLLGLPSATRIFYSVGFPGTVLAGGDSLHSFETAPPPGSTAPIRIWAFGDAGRGTAAQATIRNGYLTYAAGHPADVWLMMGDNAYDTGADSEYQAGVFDMYPMLLPTLCLFPARGNHDQLWSGANNDFLEIFSPPSQGQGGGTPSNTRSYYSFDHGNVHFVCLDSEGSSRLPGSPMLNWLQQDLANSPGTWVIVYWHHPAYSKGSHDSDNVNDSEGKMRDMRQYVLPILDTYGADLVLVGHSHNYERSMLIDGHYGVSTTLTPQMVLDDGDGRIDGDGPYQKQTPGSGPHEGIVYVTAGAAALAGGGTLDHPVMAQSLNVTGTLVLDVEGLRLDGRYISQTGAVLDSFTILKGAPVGVEPPHDVRGLRLRLAGANPVVDDAALEFRIPEAGPVRLSIVDPAGRRVATLVDRSLPAGDHHASWNGLTRSGAATAPGVYLAVLETGGGRRVIKLVRAH